MRQGSGKLLNRYFCRADSPAKQQACPFCVACGFVQGVNATKIICRALLTNEIMVHILFTSKLFNMRQTHENLPRKRKVFKALCDPKRLAILEQLRSGEKCACVLQEPMDLTQSGLSYHMKILCDSGLW